MKTVCEPARFGFPLSRTISIVRLILLVRFTSVSENSETRGCLIAVTDRTSDLLELVRVRLFSDAFFEARGTRRRCQTCFRADYSFPVPFARQGGLVHSNVPVGRLGQSRISRD